MTTDSLSLPPLTKIQRRLVGHGLIVILMAMFAGFVLGFSLVGGLETSPGNIEPLAIPGTTAGWARMHVGCVTNGLMLIALAFVLPRIGFAVRTQGLLSWTLVAIAWVNTLFYLFGNLSPNRGLTVGANQFGESSALGLLAMVPAAVGSFAIVVVLLMLITKTFRG